MTGAEETDWLIRTQLSCAEQAQAGGWFGHDTHCLGNKSKCIDEEEEETKEKDKGVCGICYCTGF